MIHCARCGAYIRTPYFPLSIPGSQSEATTAVASDKNLRRRSKTQELAKATKALGLSRREIPNWIADAVFGFEGRIIWPNGDPFHLSDTAVDDAFNDDGSFRWLSDFLHFAEIPPRQRPQERVLPRLRLIDLAFRIAHPDRAALIAK